MNKFDEILNERSNRYGDFEMLSDISQTMKELWYFTQNDNFKEPTNAMNEAMEMVLHKLARCFNGDRYYEDNIIDAINYLRLYLKSIENVNNEINECSDNVIKDLEKRYNFK